MKTKIIYKNGSYYLLQKISRLETLIRFVFIYFHNENFFYNVIGNYPRLIMAMDAQKQIHQQFEKENNIKKRALQIKNIRKKRERIFKPLIRISK